jgi:hypothetical protein
MNREKPSYSPQMTEWLNPVKHPGISTLKPEEFSSNFDTNFIVGLQKHCRANLVMVKSIPPEFFSTCSRPCGKYDPFDHSVKGFLTSEVLHLAQKNREIRTSLKDILSLPSSEEIMGLSQSDLSNLYDALLGDFVNHSKEYKYKEEDKKDLILKLSDQVKLTSVLLEFLGFFHLEIPQALKDILSGDLHEHTI